MKNRCLRLLLTISCAALMHASSSAAPLPQGSSERPASGTREQQQVSTHRAVAESRVVRRRAGRILAGPDSPMGRKHFAPARSWNQPGAARSGTVAPQFQNRGLGHPSAIPLPSVVHGSNVRHRGANPAVIGGSANSDARSTGGLNGTRMPRRP